MDFLNEPGVFWTIVVLLFLLGCWVLFQVIKYWHKIKWIRWPIVVMLSLAGGFLLHDLYDDRFGEPCPPYMAPPAPIVPPLTEQASPPAPNSQESLEQNPAPAH